MNENSELNPVCLECGRRFLTRDHIAKIFKNAEKEWDGQYVDHDNYISVWHLMADRLTEAEKLW